MCPRKLLGEEKGGGVHVGLLLWRGSNFRSAASPLSLVVSYRDLGLSAFCHSSNETNWAYFPAVQPYPAGQLNVCYASNQHANFLAETSSSTSATLLFTSVSFRNIHCTCLKSDRYVVETHRAIEASGISK